MITSINQKKESHDKRLESAVYFDCRNYSHRDRVDRVRQGALVLLYVPVVALIFAGVTGICPGLIFWKKVGLK